MTSSEAVVGIPGPAGKAPDPTILGEHSLGLDASAHARAGFYGAREVGDVGGPLGVEPAPEWTGAALHAGAGVPADRPAARAKGLRALHAELAVSPHPVRVDRGQPAPPPPPGSRVHSVAQGIHLPLAPLREHLAGARKHVPELITVVPPTVRPTGTGIAGLPAAIVIPPSR